MDIIDEIRDDLRKEKYYQLWKDYGRYFLIILVIIIVVLSGFLIYNSHLRKKQQEVNYLILKQGSILEPDLAKVNAFEKIAATAPRQQKVIAQLKKANILVKYDINKAKQEYKKIFDDEGNNKIFRYYAEVMLNYVSCKRTVLNDLGADGIDIISPNNPFYNEILKIRAICYIENDKVDLAKNELQKIMQNTKANKESRDFAAMILETIESK